MNIQLIMSLEIFFLFFYEHTINYVLGDFFFFSFFFFSFKFKKKATKYHKSCRLSSVVKKKKYQQSGFQLYKACECWHSLIQ